MTPHLKGRKGPATMPINFSSINKAIATAKNAIQFFTAGVPIIKKSPKGEVHVDVPVMYMDFAIDKIHFDVQSKTPSPKGRSVGIGGGAEPQEIRKAVEKILKEAKVVEAVEFREVEKAWIIPVVWNKVVVMHIKISQDGERIIPDYKLTEEVRRYVN